MGRPAAAAPWSPIALLAWGLLAGPLVGGAFATVNAGRLGLKEMVWPTLLMGAVAQAAPIVLREWVLNVSPTSPTALNLYLVFTVIAAYYFSYSQREAYWKHVDSGGRRANPALPSLLCAAVFLVVMFFSFPGR